MSWKHRIYETGVQVVTKGLNYTWLCVHGPEPISKSIEDAKDSTNVQINMCVELMEYLNGGSAPKWLNDMQRSSLTTLLGSDGSKIISCGPVDMNGNWRLDPEAAALRTELINDLVERARTKDAT